MGGKRFLMCLDCLFLHDQYSYENFEEVQALQGKDAGRYEPTSPEETRQDILNRSNLVKGLLRRLNSSLRKGMRISAGAENQLKFLDFGGAAGLSLFACEEMFAGGGGLY